MHAPAIVQAHHTGGQLGLVDGALLCWSSGWCNDRDDVRRWRRVRTEEHGEGEQREQGRKKQEISAHADLGMGVDG